jgi:hypothetical protein
MRSPELHRHESLVTIWQLTSVGCCCALVMACSAGCLGCQTSGKDVALVSVFKREYLTYLDHVAPGVDKDLPLVRQQFAYVGTVKSPRGTAYHFVVFRYVWKTSSLELASIRETDKLLAFDHYFRFAGEYILHQGACDAVVRANKIVLASTEGRPREVVIGVTDRGPSDPPPQSFDVVGPFHPREE